jgi:hypothetical protein
MAMARRGTGFGGETSQTVLCVNPVGRRTSGPWSVLAAVIGLALALVLVVTDATAFSAATVFERQPALADAAACSQRYTRLLPIELERGLTTVEAVQRAFRPSRVWGVAENVRLVAAAPGRRPVLAVRYPEGSINPSNAAPRGGAGFVSRAGLENGVDAACLRYRVRFAEGFAFAKGGKLPGLYGGDGPVGGAVADAGFSTRLMWRAAGRGELYAYLPLAGNTSGRQYGQSLGRGAWRFPAGRWVTVEQEIVLNDPGAANGIARVWIDGVLSLERRDLVFRHVPAVRIEGLMFSTFFGGSDPSWASPRDQEASFADFAVHLPASRPTPVAAGAPDGRRAAAG